MRRKIGTCTVKCSRCGVTKCVNLYTFKNIISITEIPSNFGMHKCYSHDSLFGYFLPYSFNPTSDESNLNDIEQGDSCSIIKIQNKEDEA